VWVTTCGTVLCRLLCLLPGAFCAYMCCCAPSLLHRYDVPEMPASYYLTPRPGYAGETEIKTEVQQAETELGREGEGAAGGVDLQQQQLAQQPQQLQQQQAAAIQPAVLQQQPQQPVQQEHQQLPGGKQEVDDVSVGVTSAGLSRRYKGEDTGSLFYGGIIPKRKRTRLGAMPS